MLLNKSNKFCIVIIQGTYNLREKKLGKRTSVVRCRKYILKTIYLTKYIKVFMVLFVAVERRYLLYISLDNSI